MEPAIKKCGGCTVLEFVDSPIGESSQRMPQLTTTLLQKYGAKWTYSLAINDLYFDFMGPSLAAAGMKGDGAAEDISAGDGSESAFQRIRAKQYQAGTVPEPLNDAGLAIGRRAEPRLQQAALVRLRLRHPSGDARQHRASTAAPRTCSIPTTAIATSTRRSGA